MLAAQPVERMHGGFVATNPRSARFFSFFLGALFALALIGRGFFYSVRFHSSQSAFFSAKERVITAHKKCAELNHAV
jgi:hypothetical protein